MSGKHSKSRIYSVEGLPSGLWDDLSTPPVVRKPVTRERGLGSTRWNEIQDWSSAAVVKPSTAPARNESAPLHTPVKSADVCGSGGTAVKKRRVWKSTDSQVSPRPPLAPLSPVKKPSLPPVADILDLNIGELLIAADRSTSPDEILLDCGITVSPRALRASETKKRRNKQLYEERTLELQIGLREQKIKKLCGDLQWVKQWDASCTVQRAVRKMLAMKECDLLRLSQQKQVPRMKKPQDKRLVKRHQDAITQYDKRYEAGLVLQKAGRGNLGRVHMLSLKVDAQACLYVKQSLAVSTIAAFMRFKISSGVVSAMLHDKVLEAFYVFTTSAKCIQRHWAAYNAKRHASATTVQRFWRSRIALCRLRNEKNARNLLCKNQQLLVSSYYHKLHEHQENQSYQRVRLQALETRADILRVKTCQKMARGAFRKLKNYSKLDAVERLRAANRVVLVKGHYDMLLLSGRLAAKRRVRNGLTMRLAFKNERIILQNYYNKLDVASKVGAARKNSEKKLLGRYFAHLLAVKAVRAKAQAEARAQEEVRAKEKAEAQEEVRARAEAEAKEQAAQAQAKADTETFKQTQKQVEVEDKSTYPALKVLFDVSETSGLLQVLKLAVHISNNGEGVSGVYPASPDPPSRAPSPMSTPEPPPMLVNIPADISYIQTLFAVADAHPAQYMHLEMYKAYLQGTATTVPPSPPSWSLEEEQATVVIQQAWKVAHKKPVQARPQSSIEEICSCTIQKAWRRKRSRMVVMDLRAKRNAVYAHLKLEGAACVLQPTGRGYCTRVQLRKASQRESLEKLERKHTVRVVERHWRRWLEYVKMKESGAESQNSTVLHTARSCHETTAATHTTTRLKSLRHLRFLYDVALQRELDAQE